MVFHLETKRMGQRLCLKFDRCLYLTVGPPLRPAVTRLLLYVSNHFAYTQGNWAKIYGRGELLSRTVQKAFNAYPVSTISSSYNVLECCINEHNQAPSLLAQLHSLCFFFSIWCSLLTGFHKLEKIRRYREQCEAGDYGELNPPKSSFNWFYDEQLIEQRCVPVPLQQVTTNHNLNVPSCTSSASRL